MHDVMHVIKRAQCHGLTARNMPCITSCRKYL